MFLFYSIFFFEKKSENVLFLCLYFTDLFATYLVYSAVNWKRGPQRSLLYACTHRLPNFFLRGPNTLLRPENQADKVSWS